MIRALLVIAVIGLPLPLFGQDSPVGSITFNHVAISVHDADQSAAFYRNVFGLNEITNRTEVEGIRWFSLGEDKELHLISVVREPVSLNKAVHFALTTPDFDGFVEVLRHSGIRFSDWAGNAGKITVRADDTKQLYIQDVDGYWIEVNSTAAE